MIISRVWLSIFGPVMAVLSPDQILISLFPPSWTRAEGKRMALELKEELERQFPSLKFEDPKVYLGERISGTIAVHWQAMGSVVLGEDDKLLVVLPSPDLASG